MITVAKRSPYRSSVGRKITMAASGAVLLAFVTVHMAGNLKFFQGSAPLDAYAGWLRRIGGPIVPHNWFLWIQRLVLTAALLVHVASAVQLTRRKRAARPHDYAKAARSWKDLPARTMWWGGIAILAFTLFHLLDLTTGTTHPDFIHGAVYHNVVVSLSRLPVVAVYAIGVVSLGLHLHHGVWSMLQTLGIGNARHRHAIKRLSAATAAVLTVGFMSLPVAVLIRIVQ